jgi:hypothetical protein
MQNTHAILASIFCISARLRSQYHWRPRPPVEVGIRSVDSPSSMTVKERVISEDENSETSQAAIPIRHHNFCRASTSLRRREVDRNRMRCASQVGDDESPDPLVWNMNQPLRRGYFGGNEPEPRVRAKLSERALFVPQWHFGLSK